MAELVAAFVCGAVFGGLIVAAWTSDREKRPEVHSGPDDFERRARRVQ